MRFMADTVAPSVGFTQARSPGEILDEPSMLPFPSPSIDKRQD
jgi:hypothetical protein